MNCASPFSQHASAKKKVPVPLQERAMGAGPTRDLPLLCGEAASGPGHAHLWLRAPPQSQRLPCRGEFCRLRWRCTWKKSLGWFQMCLFATWIQLLFLRYLGVLCPGLWGYGGAGEKRLSYSITWFCSWSPCVNCSIQISQFLRNMPNLRLRIFVSRLYFCDMEDSLEREGLRMLTRAGVRISVMSYKGACV